ERAQEAQIYESEVTEESKKLLIYFPSASIFAVVAHHALELREVHVAVAVGIDRFDHVVAFFDGAAHSEAVQNLAELGGGDEPVLVLVVHVEGVLDLCVATVSGICAVERGKLGKVNETVVVGVEVVYDALELLRRDAGSKGAEDVLQLADGDLAVAVGVEAVEDSLHLVHVLEVDG
ncbi:hypothetical protein V8G54_002939, partial [Vigna mungo]